ncbi:MAG: PQQ-dependent sugar dehydrogenase, partial [Pseudomonadota bacterium]
GATREITMLRLVAALTLAASPALAEIHQTSAGPVEVTRLVSDLDTPWSVAFLPDGTFLITERDGALLHASDGETKAISGVPEVEASGQGGLFDVVLARDFAETREIFLSYAETRDRRTGTALAVARLSDDAKALEDLRVIFRMNSDGGGRHFGGRIVEAPDGHLFLTLGDRGDRPSAQSEREHNGKVIRIARDGSVPADNPFIGGPYPPEAWSVGHRNPQGFALDAEGRLWTNSHGARGGDEINLIEPGLNYGWPVISYGVHYTYLPIGEGTAKEGMEQPKFYWDPSIAPSGMTIYSGALWPEWEGDLFVGSLKFDMISRLDRNGEEIGGEERLFVDEYYRIRDVREGPDGALYFLAEADGALYRVAPAE